MPEKQSLDTENCVRARVLELQERQLAAKRLPRDVGARAPWSLGKLSELTLESAIEANGERRALLHS